MGASASGAERARLTFSDADGSVTTALGASGPASYGVSIFTGSYGATFDGTDCPTSGQGATPCQDEVVLGCGG